MHRSRSYRELDNNPPGGIQCMDVNPVQGVICMSATEQPALASPGYLEPEAQRRLVHRLSRIEGHVRSIRQMVVDQRCADEILLQVAAVKAALNAFAGQIVDHELKACVESCMEGEGDERLERVSKVLGTLLKQS